MAFPGCIRALFIALLATMATGTPVNTCDITPCATVKCTATTTCEVIDGKAQCVPIGEQCGAVVCPTGLTCCNASCGICTKPGEFCTQQACLPKACGPTVCKPGLECCNESCGICVEPGKGCTKQFCRREECGKTLCEIGMVCCNPSCGICTPPGGVCTQQVCTD